MDRWRLFLQRNQCGINFMSAIFYINEDAKLAKAFHNHFCLPYTKYLELLEDICSNEYCSTAGVGISAAIKKWLQWSCLFLVCFVTLVVVGPLMTVKSPLPLIRMFTECFFMFSLCMAVLFFTKDGVNTCKFAQSAVKHEGVPQGQVPGLRWVI